ncbi:hypothetical protein MTO96_048450 [Rhipicephalus appendiculatus]
MNNQTDTQDTFVAAVEQLIAAIEADDDLEYDRAGPPPPVSGHTAPDRHSPAAGLPYSDRRPPATGLPYSDRRPLATEPPYPDRRPLATEPPYSDRRPLATEPPYSDRHSPAPGPPHLPHAMKEGEPVFTARPFAHPMPPGEIPTSSYPRAPAGPPPHEEQPYEAVPLKEAPSGHAGRPVPTGPENYTSEGRRTEDGHMGVIPRPGSDPRRRPLETEGGARAQRYTTPTSSSAEVEHRSVRDVHERASDEKAGGALRRRDHLEREDHRSPTRRSSGVWGSYPPPRSDRRASQHSIMKNVDRRRSRSATPEDRKTGSVKHSTTTDSAKKEATGKRAPPHALTASHSSSHGGRKGAPMKSPKDQKPSERGPFGAVRGQRLVVSDMGHKFTVDAFLGLPFAKVPRGPLRFKPPQPLDSLLGDGEKPLDSKHKRPPCPQQDFYLGHDVVSTSNGSEDCLHLNIWAPPSNCTTGKELGPCDKRPVLFFLYGTAFQNGGNSFELYDGRYLAALGNLVVVVPNYRVGALGFLTGPWKKGIPGNAGLLDQQLAFEWTLANIVSFGGDLSRLVLAGHDAGASSLGYHLFYGNTAFWTQNATRFILQSGGPYHRYESQGIEGARRLAESLHCPSDLSTNKAIACLQDADVSAVARNPLALNFGPVFTKELLTMPKTQNGQGRSLTKGRLVQESEFLLGRAASEGVYTWFVAQQRSASGDVRRLAARLLGDEVLERWQTATGITLDADSPVTTYQQAVGDVLDACPMSELAEQLQAWQNRVYVYVLGYKPSYSRWKDQNETVHFEDVELVFGVPLKHGVSSTDEDKRWSRTMMDLWATFAHKGRAPHEGQAKWSLYDSAHPKIMKLGPKEVGEQSDTKAQECAIVLSGPSTTPSGHHGTAPHGGATRASATFRGYVVAVAALVCANIALRA